MAELLTAAQVARYLQCSIRTLQTMAMQGRGPNFVRIGNRTRYRAEDIEAWIDANTKQTSGASTLLRTGAIGPVDDVTLTTHAGNTYVSVDGGEFGDAPEGNTITVASERRGI